MGGEAGGGGGGQIELGVIRITVKLDVMFSKDFAKLKETDDKNERVEDRILWTTRTEKEWMRGE